LQSKRDGEEGGSSRGEKKKGAIFMVIRREKSPYSGGQCPVSMFHQRNPKQKREDGSGVPTDATTSQIEPKKGIFFPSFGGEKEEAGPRLRALNRPDRGEKNGAGICPPPI